MNSALPGAGQICAQLPQPWQSYGETTMANLLPSFTPMAGLDG